MQHDPVLDFLRAAERSTAEAHEAALAALVAYGGDALADPEDDLISLKDAQVEFRISNLTARRWAKDKNLGVERDGRLYLRRSLVRRYKIA